MLYYLIDFFFPSQFIILVCLQLYTAHLEFVFMMDICLLLFGYILIIMKTIQTAMKAPLII